jgi:hypothetical protein
LPGGSAPDLNDDPAVRGDVRGGGVAPIQDAHGREDPGAVELDRYAAADVVHVQRERVADLDGAQLVVLLGCAFRSGQRSAV